MALFKKFSSVSLFAAGALLGAASAYIFDPIEGRHRRALLRDRGAKLQHRVAKDLSRRGRNLQNRLQGLAHRPSTEIPVSDEILVARIRSKLGRVVRHPRAIDVEVINGQVMLQGDVLTAEVETLIANIQLVPGVRDLEIELDLRDDWSA